MLADDIQDKIIGAPFGEAMASQISSIEASDQRCGGELMVMVWKGGGLGAQEVKAPGWQNNIAKPHNSRGLIVRQRKLIAAFEFCSSPFHNCYVSIAQQQTTISSLFSHQQSTTTIIRMY